MYIKKEFCKSKLKVDLNTITRVYLSIMLLVQLEQLFSPFAPFPRVV